MKTPLFFRLSTLLVLFFLLTGLVASAQIEVGAIGGLNITNVRGQDIQGNNQWKLGVHLGAYGRYKFDEHWAARPEVIVFSMKGTASGGFSTFYVDIPLLAEYTLEKNFRFLAGIQPSILYRASVDDGRGVITDLIRTVDIGVVFGAWYQNTQKLGFGLRFVPGLSRVGADGNERTFNFAIQMGVGYRLF